MFVIDNELKINNCFEVMYKQNLLPSIFPKVYHPKNFQGSMKQSYSLSLAGRMG